MKKKELLRTVVHAIEAEDLAVEMQDEASFAIANLAKDCTKLFI